MRTLAMTVASLGCAAMAVGWMLFVALLLLPIRDQPVAAVLIPISIVFIALFSLFALLGAFWSGARSRAWFWIVEAVAAVIVVVLNAPYIPYALAHPAETSSFLVTVIVVSAGAAILVAGIAAALDVRRGRQTWSPDGRSGVVLVAIVAALVGAMATSVVAGSASAGGGQIAAAPTATQSISIAGGAFQQPRLTMSGDDVLGLFITNADATGHAFDIDSLGIHVQLPAGSTTAIAVRPIGSGPLEFYCSVPGHRDAGMVGTIEVD